jgi:hypothetical protein
MTGDIEPVHAAAPPHSRKQIAIASGIALLVALTLLVTIVVPAEYGVDPLGTGRALGLTALSGAAVAAAPVAPPQGTALAPVAEGSFALYPGEYKVDSREFVLGPYEYIEYKYHLEKNATMLFSWSSTGDVLQEFHGDPDGAPSNASQSYDKNPRRKADGSFLAPFSGIHGWYWENPDGESVTVKVTTAGFYTQAHEFHFNGTRQTKEVRALDAISVSDN